MNPLTEKYKPAKLAEFIGLRRPRAVLSQLAARPYTSAWLLLGPSGFGKTTLALTLAEAIGGEIHHVPWSGGAFHVVIVDEADRMSKAAQLALLSKLDSTAAPPNTIWLFTANETTLLEDRFLSRVRTLQFEVPDAADVRAHLARVWSEECGSAAPPDLDAIITDSKGNIRECLMRLEIEIMMALAEPEPVAPRVAAPVAAEPVEEPDYIADLRASLAALEASHA